MTETFEGNSLLGTLTKLHLKHTTQCLSRWEIENIDDFWSKNSFFFSLSRFSFRSCNPIQIGKKCKWWWHSAVYKRRFSCNVSKFWLINSRIFRWNQIKEKDMAPLQLYNPKKNLITNHLNCIGRNLNLQLEECENFILMSNFNHSRIKWCRYEKFLSDVRSTVAKILSKIRPVSKFP